MKCSLAKTYRITSKVQVVLMNTPEKAMKISILARFVILVVLQMISFRSFVILVFLVLNFPSRWFVIPFDRSMNSTRSTLPKTEQHVRISKERSNFFKNSVLMQVGCNQCLTKLIIASLVTFPNPTGWLLPSFASDNHFDFFSFFISSVARLLGCPVFKKDGFCLYFWVKRFAWFIQRFFHIRFSWI